MDVKAAYQEAVAGGGVRCKLCPRNCLVAPGKSGYCGIRSNREGVLYADSWGHPVAVAIDPVEKKPFAGFLPGSRAFSIGSFGCNLGCVFCQNFDLSRGCYRESDLQKEIIPPERIPQLARHYNCASVAYTYNEPGVFFEYVLETAHEVRKAGLKNLLVSNGFLAPEPAEELYPLMDAVNFDMKGFSEEFYRTMCGASLAPVLENYLRYERTGGHAEYTNLVIPGKNDSDEMISLWLDWAAENLTTEAWLHFSAYFPVKIYRDSPPTPKETLFHIQEMVLRRGFRHVFLGNIR